MTTHHEHDAATGDANPGNQVTSSEVSAHISQLPVTTSPEHFRVCSELAPPSSTVDHSEPSESNGSERNGGVSTGFEVGDMVWAKVKSHPWWPGHIYNEAFASAAVRRSKREGLVLVAFFGDSSYGWFESGELIPFDENFAEKSRQVNSRAFLKAVEEAVEEASRRSALGLVCRCRNANIFHPTTVQGYFSVHVPDFEPGIYSTAQIRKAINGLGPAEALAFVKQFASAPHGGGHRSIGFTKNKAAVVGFRRGVFEQYDEPYALAFDQPVGHPIRAPLSGLLVTGETLGGRKKTPKSPKVKDNSNKDNYIFKRRDEPSDCFQLTTKEDTPDAAEKRPLAVAVAPQVLEKHEDTKFVSQDGADSAIKAKVTVEGQVQPDGTGLTSPEITFDADLCLDKGNESSEEMTKSFEPVDVASKSMGRPDSSEVMALPSIVDETSQSTPLESKTSIDVKHDVNVVLSGPHKDFLQTEQGCLTVTDEVKHHKLTVDGVLKKVKVRKRPADDVNSETSGILEKKKKKKKGSFNTQPTSGHMEKTSEKSVHLSGKLIGKPVSIGLAPREDIPKEPGQMDASGNNLLPVGNKAEVNLELPQLLVELQALALDPFHSVKRGIPAVTQQFFLRFRSLVYQKSLVLSPPTENEAPEVRPSKSTSSFGASDSPNDRARASPLVKSVKHIVRGDDPTKVGRKRAPSDRQEEYTAKRLKKIQDIKSLAAEKKAASQKTSEARQGEGKGSMIQAPPKLVKPNLTRKVERPAKPLEPTVLVIRFPPGTSLPSVAELKARFARFGPIDQSSLRVFWKSSSCRVIFMHRVDAKTAYKHAVANQSLFGNVAVRYFLRELGDSSLDVSEAAKGRGDVKVFDPKVATWSTLKTYGKPPVSRGGQSVTLVGNGLVIFGGQDAKRTLLNDLHILDLESMTWDEIDAVGVPPSPRSDHAAAVHVERYLLIFGGGSHATCYNDLHVLDLQTMEWSRPTQLGEIPTARAGHAGVTVGENWFIVGGGDNKSGVSETVVLNMSTLTWSVVTSVQGRVPVASEGLSLVVSSYDGGDLLVSFGGYNGRYNNEVYVLKPSHKSTLQSNTSENPIPDSVSAVHNATNATRDAESEFEAGHESKIKELVVDNGDSRKLKGDVISVLRAEKDELESSLSKEKLHTLQLKQELGEAEGRNSDLCKELQSVRGQLAAEQSRCFKLEVEVAELGQKLQTIGTLQKELELLQRQKAASEQAALSAKQRQGSGGVWGWLAGTPPNQQEED
ncbi:PWWP domain-containing protein 1-like isoform X2 [Lotus japonicus]|uniref:PWWP domain-containing protein 1-like isoform X2 n=1 Tax=Lotus japonicus TaxID=34305 RepID=UPI0025891E4C|nr:PWWP domain-containing protein 1-like isoform X2 [Lotus japonicus]